jgi:hypothetical protein
MSYEQMVASKKKAHLKFNAGVLMVFQLSLFMSALRVLQSRLTFLFVIVIEDVLLSCKGLLCYDADLF